MKFALELSLCPSSGVAFGDVGLGTVLYVDRHQLITACCINNNNNNYNCWHLCQLDSVSPKSATRGAEQICCDC